MSIVPPAKSTRGGAEDSIIIAIDFFVEIRYQDRTTPWRAPPGGALLLLLYITRMTKRRQASALQRTDKVSDERQIQKF